MPEMYLQDQLRDLSLEAMRFKEIIHKLFPWELEALNSEFNDEMLGVCVEIKRLRRIMYKIHGKLLTIKYRNGGTIRGKKLGDDFIRYALITLFARRAYPPKEAVNASWALLDQYNNVTSEYRFIMRGNAQIITGLMANPGLKFTRSGQKTLLSSDLYSTIEALKNGGVLFKGIHATFRNRGIRRLTRATDYKHFYMVRSLKGLSAAELPPIIEYRKPYGPRGKTEVHQGGGPVQVHEGGPVIEGD